MMSCETLITAARFFSSIQTIRGIFNFTLAFLILHVAFFLIQYSLSFGISSGDFQHKNRSANVALFPDHLTGIRMLFFLISKKIFVIFACKNLEQVGFLKIRFVSYITDTLTYSVLYAIFGKYIAFHYHAHIPFSESTLR